MTTLAKKHLISPSQLEQLENGGESYFYSAQIKFNVGHKLVKALGEDLVMPTSDMRTQAPATVSASLGSYPPDPSGAKVLSYRIAQNTPLNSSRTPSWLWMTLIALLALTTMVLLLPTSNPPSVDVRTPLADASAIKVNQNEGLVPQTLATTDNATNRVSPIGLPEPPGTSQSQTAVQTVTENTAPAQLSACPWEIPAVDLTPDNDDRRTTYIHLVALQTVTLCWRDAQRKSETIQLKPNQTLTLTGQPPFSISSANPDGFSLFFKGRRVRWSESGAAHFTLHAR